jgi:hypothetical protein
MPLTQGRAVSEHHTALMMVVAELNSAPLVQEVGAQIWQLPSSLLAMESKLLAAVFVQPGVRSKRWRRRRGRRCVDVH